MANLFPKSINTLPIKIIVAIVFIVAAITAGVTYYFTPEYTRIGYAPTQPVAFSHALHVDQLGMDCRYCHTHVDRAAHANIPPSNTCMSCHSLVKVDSPALAPVRASYESGNPIPWVRVHAAPDYVYFNHAAHVNRGISCVECHGQVNQMEVVYHAKSLSMAFCLECHRNPEQYIRPLEAVYDLNWERPTEPEAVAELETFVHDWKVNPPQSCSGCHR